MISLKFCFSNLQFWPGAKVLKQEQHIPNPTTLTPNKFKSNITRNFKRAYIHLLGYVKK